MEDGSIVNEGLAVTEEAEPIEVLVRFSGELSTKAKRTRTRFEPSSNAVTDSLEAWADSLESVPAVIEKVARERYGFIRDGEHLFRFIEVDTGAGRRVDR